MKVASIDAVETHVAKTKTISSILRKKIHHKEEVFGCEYLYFSRNFFIEQIHHSFAVV